MKLRHYRVLFGHCQGAGAIVRHTVAIRAHSAEDAERRAIAHAPKAMYLIGAERMERDIA